MILWGGLGGRTLRVFLQYSTSGWNTLVLERLDLIHRIDWCIPYTLHCIIQKVTLKGNLLCCHKKRWAWP